MGEDNQFSADEVCRVALLMVHQGGGLEDLVRALTDFTFEGRGQAVIEAERACRAHPDKDRSHAKAASLLRHAVDTGLFYGP